MGPLPSVQWVMEYLVKRAGAEEETILPRRDRTEELPDWSQVDDLAYGLGFPAAVKRRAFWSAIEAVAKERKDEETEAVLIMMEVAEVEVVGVESIKATLYSKVSVTLTKESLLNAGVSPKVIQKATKRTEKTRVRFGRIRDDQD